MKAKDFDELFDEGASIIPYADMSSATRPNKVKRVNVDFPLWLADKVEQRTWAV